MPLFDVYIAVDFSGAKDANRQKASIALAEIERGSAPRIETDRFTRFDVIWFLLQRILHHNSAGRRVLAGFDFCFSFPDGFWAALTNSPADWGSLIRGMAEGVVNLPAIVDKPESNARKWAEMANQRIARKLDMKTGPFWGPGFSQITNPGFPFSRSQFAERRLVERREPGFKSVFQVGGQGAVGLQSLCGIPYLHHIRTTCAQQKANLHCWPFDGWNVEPSSHLMVEFYPALFNQGEKSHASDALACGNWAMEMDDEGELATYLHPGLSDSENAQAVVEGWVLGVL